MIRPIALVEDVKGQTQAVDQALEQMKQEIESGHEQVNHEVDMQKFYNLLLKKGVDK